jgi:hypothetical protein
VTKLLGDGLSQPIVNGDAMPVRRQPNSLRFATFGNAVD